MILYDIISYKSMETKETEQQDKETTEFLLNPDLFMDKIMARLAMLRVLNSNSTMFWHNVDKMFRLYGPVCEEVWMKYPYPTNEQQCANYNTIRQMFLQTRATQYGPYNVFKLVHQLVSDKLNNKQ